MATRDIICIGASAGGVPALEQLIRRLPEDIAATILIVLHTGRGPSHLPEILARAGGLSAKFAENGEHFLRGQIYVCPPDRHLLLKANRLRLVDGPRVNHSRPAIDPLFYSAARLHGDQTIGVILSGMLFDGAAGLLELSRAGGITMIQAPADAFAPDMPRNARARVKPDFVETASGIGDRLAEIAGTEFHGRACDVEPRSSLRASLTALPPTWD